MGAGASTCMTEQANLPRYLKYRRLFARYIILFEILWLEFCLPLLPLCLFICLALVNLPHWLGWQAHLLLLTITGVATVWLLCSRLSDVEIPDGGAVDRRLEKFSGLSHQPLAVLSDQPAMASSSSNLLWDIHKKRSLVRAEHLRLNYPRPDLASRDIFSFRFALLLGTVACAVIANTEIPDRLYSAINPFLFIAPSSSVIFLHAWILPPAYTHTAPTFLRASDKSAVAPVGSRLLVNLPAAAAVPSLSINGGSRSFDLLDGRNLEANVPLTESGLAGVKSGGISIASWALEITPDLSPSVSWLDNFQIQQRGRQIWIGWQAYDDYGVIRLEANFRLYDRPTSSPLVVPVSLPSSSPKSTRGISRIDLTAHPWAGLRVLVRLVGYDALQQTGCSGARVLYLPERRFNQPVTRLLIAARKTLSLHPDDRTDAVAILDRIIQDPSPFAGDLGSFSVVVGIYYELVRDHSSGAVTEAQDMMWRLALHIDEEQGLQTVRLLRDAVQAARDALEIGASSNAYKTKLELPTVLDQLRRAMQGGTETPRGKESKKDIADAEKTRRFRTDIETAIRRIRHAAENAQMSEVRQQLAEIDKMIDRLQTHGLVRGNKGPISIDRDNQWPNAAAQDLIVRERVLLDHSARHARQALSRTSFARDEQVQRVLQRAVGKLDKMLTDSIGNTPSDLEQAYQSMREAAKLLKSGNYVPARTEQSRAISALQTVDNELGKQGSATRHQSADDGSGLRGKDAQRNDDRGSGVGAGEVVPSSSPNDGLGGPFYKSDLEISPDPLGRPNQWMRESHETNVLMGQGLSARIDALEKELRRRSSDQQRASQELNYIHRLLEKYNPYTESNQPYDR